MDNKHKLSFAMNLSSRTLLNFLLLIIALCCFMSCSEVAIVDDEEKLESIGSWTKLNKGVALPGTQGFNCFLNGDNVYVLFQESEFFSFNTNSFEVYTETNFPVSGNSGTQYAAAQLGPNFYVFNTFDNKIYSYTEGNWCEVTDLPKAFIPFGGPMHSFVFENSMYLPGKKCKYNLSSGLWSEVAEAPDYWESEDHTQYIAYGGYFFAAVFYNQKAYMIKTEGDIFEYNPATDSWEHLTKYPGIILDRIVCFASANTLYFGLSHIDHSPSYNEEWLINDLWSFSLISKKWNMEEAIPFDMPHGELFSYFTNNKCYIGHAPLTKYYHLYSYEP